MQVTIKAIVTGMKRAKGTMDNGKPFDGCDFFVEEPLRSDTENGRGSCSVKHRIGVADEFNKYKDAAFPFQAELDMEMNADGKGGFRSNVVAVRVMGAPKGAPVITSANK